MCKSLSQRTHVRKITVYKNQNMHILFILKGYRCKAGIDIFAWRVTWHYAYSPFMQIYLRQHSYNLLKFKLPPNLQEKTIFASLKNHMVCYFFSYSKVQNKHLVTHLLPPARLFYCKIIHTTFRSFHWNYSRFHSLCVNPVCLSNRFINLPFCYWLLLSIIRQRLKGYWCELDMTTRNRRLLKITSTVGKIWIFSKRDGNQKTKN
jgi:hypothetical protein